MPNYPVSSYCYSRYYFLNETNLLISIFRKESVRVKQCCWAILNLVFARGKWNRGKSLTVAGDTSVGRVHALVVVPGGPLRARGVQEEGAHVLGHAGVDVGVGAVDGALGRTGRGARPGRLVPAPHGLVRHLHNHKSESTRYTDRTLLRREPLSSEDQIGEK